MFLAANSNSNDTIDFVRQRSYSDEAIVLARRSFGEADRILVLFTKNHGRVPVIAKGVRKIKSRKRGHIEVFSLIKFQAAKGKSLDILTEAEVIDSFEKIRNDLKKVSVAYFFAEAVGKITRDYEPHEELFQLITEYFAKIETSNSLKTIRNDFTVKALTIVGFWPANRKMDNPDLVLENVVEKMINSIRVGKKILS